MITKRERFMGSMYLGAIGDAIGSGFENISMNSVDETTYYPFGKPKFKLPEWKITDDTQLTVITCEALMEDLEIKPEVLCKYFVSHFSKGMIRGIGASTLKAFQDLDLGLDWSQAGRRGEYAAGNGAAMRIAPLAFFDNISRNRIEEICSITHNNSEAYIGALAVVISIKTVLRGNWLKDTSLLKIVADQLPDSYVRERILELNTLKGHVSIQKVAEKFGTNGYVVNSIPFCIFAASKIKNNHISTIFDAIVESEGDTDTNCSITGQICGAYLGIDKVPLFFKNKLKTLPEYDWLSLHINKLTDKIL